MNIDLTGLTKEQQKHKLSAYIEAKEQAANDLRIGLERANRDIITLVNMRRALECGELIG